MATLRGAVRSYGAAVRRMEREQQRQAREAAKQFKEQQKIQEIKDAQETVHIWESYVEILQSIHKNCTDQIDWHEIEKIEKPIEPTPSNKGEIIIKSKIDNFKPTFFDRLIGSTQKKLDKLSEQLIQAKHKDKVANETAYKEYLDELSNWKELQEIAKGIKNKELDAYKKALDYFDPFSDIGELGTQVSIDYHNPAYIDCDFLVNSLEVIPNYEIRLTSTGKLSKKNMPKSRFNELYQDHICSAAMRISREIFAYLPVDLSRINALVEIVDSKTGHIEVQPILSVIFSRKTIENLNLDSIDPSDSMSNFVHNMKFSKVKGFSVVDKAELDN